MGKKKAKQFMEHGAEVFGGSEEVKAYELRISQLERMLGQKEVELALLRIRSSTPGLMYEPQLSEPPDADPHVRWCGRGTAGITGCPLSRLS